MNRKPKSKLPAGWDVYSSEHKKPVRQRGNGWWKYAVWGLLLGALSFIAFYPWKF